MERADSRAPKQKTIAEKFIPLLPSLERLRINCAGEFLVSRHSRDLLKSIDPRTSPNLAIEIISNGTLFSKREWDKFENIHSVVRYVRISMDAALPHTFELVRRGGKWTVILENLRFLAQLRRENRIKLLVLAFTYQDHNFREMKEFVELSRELGADRAAFERIQKTDAMTETEYAERAVHHFAHPLHQAFLEIVRDPIFRGEGVVMDFDYQLS
jgi:MoaA/NifB/PqqE/SkfB family radical SAM enzyme